MNFRTDMAVERYDIYKKAKKKEEIPGISVKEEKFDSLCTTGPVLHQPRYNLHYWHQV